MAFAEGRGHVYLSNSPFVTGALGLSPSLAALLCGLNHPTTRCPLLVEIVQLKCCSESRNAHRIESPLLFPEQGQRGHEADIGRTESKRSNRERERHNLLS